MSGRERHNLLYYPDKVLCFTCKYNSSALIITVVQRSYTYRIPGSYIPACLAVIYDACKLSIKHPEHFRTVFEIQRKKYLTVTLTYKGISLFYQHIAEQLKVIYFAVAYTVASPCLERLHAFIMQAHYGQTVKAHYSVPGIYNTRIIGSARYGLFKSFLKLFRICLFLTICHDRAHLLCTSLIMRQ